MQEIEMKCRRKFVVMHKQVRATITKYRMLVPGDRVLIAVSGGPDSIALAHVLNSLSLDQGFKVFIAHLNHRLRGQESREDAEFVADFADKLGIQAAINGKDVAGYAKKNKLSMQVAAREVRYQFFSDTARKLDCNKLATGHNANDQAETLLNRFLRGSGPAGLGGIPPVRDGWVIRPLIEVKREETEKYCRDNNLTHRQDSSNLKSIYTRNKIRHELLPFLEQQYNANLVETLVRVSEIFREDEKYLQQHSSQVYHKACLELTADKTVFDLKEFFEASRALQARIIRQAYTTLTGTFHNISSVNLANTIDMLVNGQTGSLVDLPLGITVTKSYDRFVLSLNKSKTDVQTFVYDVVIPGLTEIPEAGKQIYATLEETFGLVKPKPDEIEVDLDKIKQPLRVRNRKPADKFRPVGMEGSKKLKEFFIDQKISRDVRDQVPIVVAGDDEIVWVAGWRADNRWIALPESKRVLKLKLLVKI
jgi:tRNA(Ile)-lysidine synthase